MQGVRGLNLSEYDGSELARLFKEAMRLYVPAEAAGVARTPARFSYDPATGDYEVYNYKNRCIVGTDRVTVQYEGEVVVAYCSCQDALKSQGKPAYITPCYHILIAYNDYITEPDADFRVEARRSLVVKTKTRRVALYCVGCGAGLVSNGSVSPVNYCDRCITAEAYGSFQDYTQLALATDNRVASWQTLEGNKAAFEAGASAALPVAMSAMDGRVKATLKEQVKKMGIKEVRGDLTKLRDVDAVVNTVNCVGVMGKGLAKNMVAALPFILAPYKKACTSGSLAPGGVQVIRNHSDDPKFIINFATKNHWRDGSRYEWIEQGLKTLVAVIKDKGIKSIALPRLGCGNGGLDWNKVKPLIETAFSELSDVEVTIYDI